MAPGRRKKIKGKGRNKVKASEDVKQKIRGTSPEESTVNTLLEQARSAVDPFFAVTLYERALQAKPDDTSIMGHAAELMLQLGQTTAAQELLSRSIALDPDNGADKYLYMAQLHEGREALDFYESGLQLLKRQHDRIAGNSTEGDATLKQKLCMAYCSVAELFLTDLCFEQDAEQRCQDALDKSMAFDYGGPEPLHALANLRLSQSKPKEAGQRAEEAFRRLCACDPPPEHEFRVSLAKILMECSDGKEECCKKALVILRGLMQEDDENVEVWYLMGVAFNSLRPPDVENARAHLNTAADMLTKIQAAQQEAGEEFAYQEQVRLVQEQLEVSAHVAETGGMSIAKSGTPEVLDSVNFVDGEPEEGGMDCG